VVIDDNVFNEFGFVNKMDPDQILGPYLVDKTELIENIVINNRLRCHVDLVL
jgi:hypothetical protein